MNPEKHPNEEFVWFGVRWTPGARKLFAWIVLSIAGGGVWGFWDQIAAMLSTAPVWAFLAFLAFGTLFLHSPAFAGLEVVSRSSVILETDYGQPCEVLQ